MRTITLQITVKDVRDALTKIAKASARLGKDAKERALVVISATDDAILFETRKPSNTKRAYNKTMLKADVKAGSFKQLVVSLDNMLKAYKWADTFDAGTFDVVIADWFGLKIGKAQLAVAQVAKDIRADVKPIKEDSAMEANEATVVKVDAADLRAALKRVKSQVMKSNKRNARYPGYDYVFFSRDDDGNVVLQATDLHVLGAALLKGSFEGDAIAKVKPAALESAIGKASGMVTISYAEDGDVTVATDESSSDIAVEDDRRVVSDAYANVKKRGHVMAAGEARVKDVLNALQVMDDDARIMFRIVNGYGIILSGSLKGSDRPHFVRLVPDDVPNDVHLLYDMTFEKSTLVKALKSFGRGAKTRVTFKYRYVDAETCPTCEIVSADVPNYREFAATMHAPVGVTATDMRREAENTADAGVTVCEAKRDSERDVEAACDEAAGKEEPQMSVADMPETEVVHTIRATRKRAADRKTVKRQAQPVAKPGRGKASDVQSADDTPTAEIPEVPPQTNTDAKVVHVSNSVVPAGMAAKDYSEFAGFAKRPRAFRSTITGRKAIYVAFDAARCVVVCKDGYTLGSDKALEHTVADYLASFGWTLAA